MKNLILTLLFAFPTFQALAQEWVRQRPFPIETEFRDIVMEESGIGWAVGEASAIIHTTNFGGTWSIVEPPSSDEFYYSLAIVPGTNGMEVYVGGQSLYKTTDGGATWIDLSDQITGTILQIQIVASGEILIAANSLYKSNDNGNSFVPIFEGSGAIRSMDFFDANLGLCITSSNKTYRTSDGGTTWTDVLDINILQTRNNIAFKDENLVYLFQRDIFYKSEDGGATWTIQAENVHSTGPRSIELGPNNRILVISNVGSILGFESYDQGLTWTTLLSPLEFGTNYNGIILPDGRLWIVGANARVVHFDENQQEWVDQISDNKSDIEAIDFLDENFGIAVGRNGTILRTFNGGLIWEIIAPPSPTTDFTRNRAVHIMDENNIWIGTQPGLLYSTDMGETFTSLPATGAISEFYPVSSSILITGNSSGVIKRSTDGGVTFETVFTASGSQQSIQSIESFNGKLYVVGWQGLYAVSEDQGVTWTESFFGENTRLNNVHFTNATTGILTFELGAGIKRTEDGGNTWTDIETPIGGRFSEVEFINDEIGYVCGGSSSFGFVLKSTDGGLTWTEDASTSDELIALSAPVSNETFAWAAGDGGAIINIIPCDGSPVLSDIIGANNICLGDTLTLEVTSTGASFFDWTLPEDWNFLGNPTAALIQVIPSANNGTVMVRGDNTCEVSEPLSISISVDEIPETPSISVDGDELSSTVMGENYLWFLDGDFLLQTTDPTFTALEEGNYSVQVSNGDCTSFTSDFISFTPCNVLPEISNLTGPVMPCIAETVTYSVESFSVGQYDWIFPPTWIVVGDSDNSTVEVVVGLNGGVISIVGLNACTETEPIELDVEVMAIPFMPSIELNGFELTCPESAVSYTWLLNDVVVAETNTGTYVPSEPGSYTVQINDGTCNSRSSNAIEVMTVSIENLETSNIRIYPNPVTSMLYIEKGNTKIDAIELFSPNGRIIKEWNNSNNEISDQLDLQNIAPSVYFLRIQTASKTYFQKLIKL